MQHYKRRQPEQSELYRLVFHGREELPRVWEERFQGEYGVLREEVLKALDEYLNCGLLYHGAARVYCHSCEHSYLVAFSCKRRGVCPSCAAKRAVMFAEHLYEEILSDVEHRHIVFTIPKRLRVYFKYDRHLNHILFTSAWSAIKHCLADEAGALVPGCVLTVQTAGEATNFQPHLHGLISNGVFAKDGTCIPFSDIDSAALTGSFGEFVCAALEAKGLIGSEVSTQIQSQEHTGFSVWLGEPFTDSESSQFVARYIEHGPLSLEKLTISGDIVTYTTKDGTAHEFDGLEFLARLTPHVPLPYESLTRFYGHYSCRSRGERAKVAQGDSSKQVEPIDTESASRPSSHWARCMKRIFEINPLECPRCKGQMRIIAFIQDPDAIAQISDALHIPPYRAPPALPRSIFYPQVGHESAA